MADLTNRYKLAALLIAILGVGVLLLYKNIIASPKQMPPIGINPSSVNLGDILQNHSSSATVVLSNQLSHPIQITDVRYSCGCTHYAIDKYLLNSNESTNLKLEVNAESREGPFEVKLILYWKDLFANVIGRSILKIRGIGKSVFKISKNRINFERIDADTQEASQQIIIKRGEATIKWDEIRVTDQANRYPIISKIDVNTFILNYKIHPYLLPIGSYKDELKLEALSHNKVVNSDFHIPVSAQIGSKFEIHPSCLYLGFIKKGDAKTGSLSIEATDGSSIKLMALNCPSCLQMKVANEKNSSLKFLYSTMNILAAGNIDEKIAITVLTDKKRIISIPVVGFAE